MGSNGGNKRFASQSCGEPNTTQDLISLIAHKNPTLKVLEINLSPKDTSSLWVQGDEASPVRAAASRYTLVASDATTLVGAQGLLSGKAPSAEFGLLDVTKTDAIVAGVNVSRSVEAGGLVLGVGRGVSLGTLGNVQDLNDKASIVQCQTTGAVQDAVQEVALPTVNFVSLTGTVYEASGKILGHIVQGGWSIQKLADASTIATGQIVLVLDELVSSVMVNPDARQWDTLKHLIQKQSKMLWVTAGAHLDVTNPDNAAIAGFFRSLRAEEGVRLVNLDVENPVGDATGPAIVSCLHVLRQPEPKSQLESEATIPATAKPTCWTSAPAAQSSTWAPSAWATMDSIHFHEVTAEPLPVEEGHVEVEVYAAGLNYKDVVVTIGIVPGDKRELGGEAAGVVTRVSPGVTSLRVRQHVVVFAPATISNRVRTRPGRVHALPDYMSLEEAATLCGVYLTSIYSLFDMAGVSASKTVLIHSAAGGVGISSMQLARYAGAEVFATVGSPEKRDFIDHVCLVMEPVDRNISLRAVDMSHQRAPDHLISRLMTKLFELLEGRHVKPISPVHIFSFADVANTVRYLRAGKAHWQGCHFRRSRAPDFSSRPTCPESLRFRDDATNLIVGGLRGLCGALAVYLAKSGAKHLAVISRSGHADEKSRSIIKQVKALGSSIELLTADGGIIQGAMVLRILHLSTLQQAGRFPDSPSAAQMVTGIVAPQPVDSALLRDARFAALRAGSGAKTSGEGGNSANADVQALLLLLRAKSAETAAQVSGNSGSKTSASSACCDSRSRWIRLDLCRCTASTPSQQWRYATGACNELGALVTTVDMMNAPSLLSFCEKIVSMIVG
ncbi:Fumagillin dodecapentaenoate synthase [Colletotrichum orbiculare MAFF 240422]|uniref:Fumagillin dodecapentaenoate synthase n=1 Tax=Colletotrichum orbiculare (strain 104-T / ATCC 96160 / CBS 514.97 / LARS 414 / MAFF 240422) TaxID=1213857 RepID=A0A484G365_COLOR|nr:Fumagillin dodecapentaenoate synthase [Colletotrichum orbiculare MAFF 240422]